jgi:hypothetical protein
MFLWLLLPVPLVAQAGPLVLPGDDVGEEHYGSPPAIDVGQQWLGLYARGDSSWVQSVSVVLEVRPPDEPGEPGTHEYVVEPRRPVLLMIGVGQARVGPARTAIGYTDALSSGEPSRELQLGSAQYQLVLDTTDPNACDDVVTLSDGQTTQRLYDAAADTTYTCDEARFDVHWAGDRDGDGRLDLLATFSSKYSYLPRRLYLSSAAAPGDIVAIVSSFER